jgi:sialate O-acetylesterase
VFGCLGALLSASGAARADVKLHALFTEGMVLQQGMPVPVWGWADNGEKVTVKILGKEVSTTARDGKWQVRLPAMKVGGPHAMTVAGRNTIELKQVFVGEVWVCSGQSNMHWMVRNTVGAEEAIAQSANPMLRLFTVPVKKSETPLDDVASQWVEAGPETVPSFSAVAYYFGRDLQKALKIPVGLIHTSLGGSPAEAWMSRRVLDPDPEYKALVDAVPPAMERYREAKAKFDEGLPKLREEVQAEVAAARKKARELLDAAQGQGDEAAAKAKAEGDELVRAAQRRGGPRLRGPRIPWVPAELYNGMIASIIPYGIKGAIWYQGESNAGRAFQYRRLFVDMIRNWRQDWGQGDFPFLCVQLAPFMKIKDQPGESAWAELREAQLLSTTAIPNVGIAVITDVGEENDIHPQRKAPVGARLALAARGIAYGEKIVYSGPVYDSMKVEGSRVVLRFKHVGSGLEARDGELKGFAVAGEDRKWLWAKAEIQGDTVVVSSPDVPKPVAVRYGWADYPVVNLWNKDGLPATPFRTDDFPMVTAPKQ